MSATRGGLRRGCPAPAPDAAKASGFTAEFTRRPSLCTDSLHVTVHALEVGWAVVLAKGQPPPPPPHPGDQNLCRFFFYIRFYMRQNPFYPEVELNFISTFWPELPSGLQAAYEFSERDEIRFFKGNASPRGPVSVDSRFGAEK